MRALAAGVAILAGVAAPAAEPPRPDDFAYAAPIATPGEAALYRADVPLEVYRRCARESLADVAVFNARGELVPYALRRVSRQQTAPRDARELPVFPLRGDPAAALSALRVTVGGGRVDVEAPPGPAAEAGGAASAFIVDARAIGHPLEALSFLWPEGEPDFAGRVAVEVSDDLAAWRTVREAAPLLSLRSGDAHLVQRRIDFAPTDGRFWRVAWLGRPLPAVVFSGVVAEPAAQVTRAPPRVLTVEAASADGREFTFDLGVELPVQRVNLLLAEPNSVAQATLAARGTDAAEWQDAGRWRFYRLRVGDGEVVNPPVDVPALRGRHWRATMEGAGAGAGAPRLRVEWIPHELVFAARGPGPFTLAFGSAAAAYSGVPYDTLVPAGDGVPAIVPVTATLGGIRDAGGPGRLVPPPAPFPVKSAVLWSVLVLGVLALGVMAWRLARELRAPPAGR